MIAEFNGVSLRIKRKESDIAFVSIGATKIMMYTKYGSLRTYSEVIGKTHSDFTIGELRNLLDQLDQLY